MRFDGRHLNKRIRDARIGCRIDFQNIVDIQISDRFGQLRGIGQLIGTDI